MQILQGFFFLLLMLFELQTLSHTAWRSFKTLRGSFSGPGTAAGCMLVILPDSVSDIPLGLEFPALKSGEMRLRGVTEEIRRF